MEEQTVGKEMGGQEAEVGKDSDARGLRADHSIACQKPATGIIRTNADGRMEMAIFPIPAPLLRRNLAACEGL